MKLGMMWGYWGQLPPPNLVESTVAAEELGFDSVWSAEAWGSDAFTPLAYLAARTSRIRLGTGIVQMFARTPAATAMSALTLDHLSGGRFILGLGLSGPQVVEGWYGQPYTKPLTRTREYVEIVRRILAREEKVEFHGEFYDLPYTGADGTGLGKPLKPITHPLRADLPIFLGAEGPKNVAQTARIADGWLPLYYSPFRQEVYADQLAGAREGFEVAVPTFVSITDDVEAGLAPVKATLGFYIGGMGAKGRNFHTELMARMGFEAEAHRIQELFLEGRKEEAVLAVPSAFADEISLVGPPERIRDRLQAWEESAVTTILTYAAPPEQLRRVAELVLG